MLLIEVTDRKYSGNVDNLNKTFTKYLINPEQVVSVNRIDNPLYNMLNLELYFVCLSNNHVCVDREDYNKIISKAIIE